MMEEAVFAVAAALMVAGALGVVFSRNPVHAALFLVQTLLAVTLLFVQLEAHFLAAVQVIVYAGAVVILFLFVIMLLGVDKAEELRIEPIAGQRPLAVITAGGLGAVIVSVVIATSAALSGPRQTAPALALDSGITDIERLGRLLFSEFGFAVEITAVLLTIAVVGAVVLTRSRRRSAPNRGS